MFHDIETKRTSLYHYLFQKLCKHGKTTMEEDIPSYYQNDEKPHSLAFPPVFVSPTIDLLDDEEDSIHSANCYSITMQKLCGVISENKSNTAVLITLSSSTLAAANAARQRRKIHH